MTKEVLCYNKGCGKNYDPSSNGDGSCTYHPGVPVFHDALKGWSCCKRRTTDFSDFLNIPGCSKGHHSNEKPEQPITPKVSSSKSNQEKGKVVTEPYISKPVHKVIEEIIRPSVDEPTIPLALKSTPSIKKAIEKLSISENDLDNVAKHVKVCKYLSCKAVYSEGMNEECIHHPGSPVFHEGMKYWSCCKQKTSNFTSFLSQKGCVKGTHNWKLKSSAESAPCRYDWHQTGSVVVISIFGKTAMAENSSVKVNQVKIEIDVDYEGGKRNFSLNVELGGVIDPSRSFVTLYGTKVEITLKKADASYWKNLKYEGAKNPDAEPAEGNKSHNQESEIENKPPSQQSVIVNDPKKESDDSDLSGIDDVEFD